MLLYIVRQLCLRLGLVVIAAALVSIVMFLSVHFLPGDPVARESHQTPAQYQRALHEAGLDLPLWQQYIHLMHRLLDGDLAALLLSEAVNSTKLGFFAGLLAVGLGLPLGSIAAARRDTWIDRVVMVGAFTGFCTPVFVWSFLLLLLFTTGLYSATGDLLTYDPGPCCGPTQIWLPVIALGLPFVGYIARMTRASMLEVMHKEFVTTARSKGLTEQRVLSVHVLRNAAIPIASVLGPLVGGLITGSLVVEKVFSVPGLGHEFSASILGRHYDTVVAVFVYYSLVVALANMVADLVYPLLDPRMRLGKS